jgi:ribosome maturation factor RimP
MQHLILDKIRTLAQPIVDQNGAFLIDVQIRGERSSKVVELFADSDDGISLEQCSAISRELSPLLDQADIIQGRYRLDVSSPGLDRPLKLLRQYKKNTDRNCKIIFEQDGQKTTVHGILKKVEPDRIIILQNNKPLAIEFSKIKETYIIPKI